MNVDKSTAISRGHLVVISWSSRGHHVVISWSMISSFIGPFLLAILMTFFFVPLWIHSQLDKPYFQLDQTSLLPLMMPSLFLIFSFDGLTFLFFIVQNIVFSWILLDRQSTGKSQSQSHGSTRSLSRGSSSWTLSGNGNGGVSGSSSNSLPSSSMYVLVCHWLATIWLFVFANFTRVAYPSRLYETGDTGGQTRVETCRNLGLAVEGHESFGFLENHPIWLYLISFICFDLCSILQIAFIGEVSQGKAKGGVLWNSYLLFQALCTLLLWWSVVFHLFGCTPMLWYWKLGAGFGSFFLFHFYSNVIHATKLFLYIGASTFSLLWIGLNLFVPVHAHALSSYASASANGSALLGSTYDQERNVCIWITVLACIFFLLGHWLQDLPFLTRSNRILYNFVFSTFVSSTICYLFLDLSIGPFLLGGEILFMLMIVADQSIQLQDME